MRPFSDDGRLVLWGGAVCEVAIAVGLILLYVYILKDRFALVLATAGREVNAIVSPSWPYVGRLVEAINHALASRY